MVGTTTSTDFPMLNPAQGTYGGGANDVFLMKFNNSGTLQFSTFLGGNGEEDVSLHLDPGRSQVYLSGQTTSTDFPTHSGFQSSYGGGAHDFYVVKYNASGVVQYSTLLGGSGDDDGTAFVNTNGTVTVIGTTSSANFPTANAYQSTYAGSNDAFVAKLSASGSSLVYSTLLGGHGAETLSGGFVDADGNAYVVGHTMSSDLPTLNAVQSTYGGAPSFGGFSFGGDIFVAKLNPSGTMVFVTYLGGSGDEIGSGQLDASGNIYIVGETSSDDFPTHNPTQATYGGPSGSFSSQGDVFVTKLNSSGAFVYSTYLGGSDIESAAYLQLDSAGNALISGMTASSDFPLMTPAQSAFGGGSSDMFITKLNASGAMQFSTYLGGNGMEFGAVTWDQQHGYIFVGGLTSSTDFPTTSGVAQQTYGGGNFDLFGVKYNNSGQIVWSTLVGGSGDETGYLLPDTTSGGMYGVGVTTSTDFPRVSPLQASYGGGTNDAFVVRLDSSGKFVYSTYLGGSGKEVGSRNPRTETVICTSGEKPPRGTSRLQTRSKGLTAELRMCSSLRSTKAERSPARTLFPPPARMLPRPLPAAALASWPAPVAHGLPQRRTVGFTHRAAALPMGRSVTRWMPTARQAAARAASRCKARPSRSTRPARVAVTRSRLRARMSPRAHRAGASA